MTDVVFEDALVRMANDAVGTISWTYFYMICVDATNSAHPQFHTYRVRSTSNVPISIRHRRFEARLRPDPHKTDSSNILEVDPFELEVRTPISVHVLHGGTGVPSISFVGNDGISSRTYDPSRTPPSAPANSAKLAPALGTGPQWAYQNFSAQMGPVATLSVSAKPKTAIQRSSKPLIAPFDSVKITAIETSSGKPTIVTLSNVNATAIEDAEVLLYAYDSSGSLSGIATIFFKPAVDVERSRYELTGNYSGNGPYTFDVCTRSLRFKNETATLLNPSSCPTDGSRPKGGYITPTQIATDALVAALKPKDDSADDPAPTFTRAYAIENLYRSALRIGLAGASSPWARQVVIRSNQSGGKYTTVESGEGAGLFGVELVTGYSWFLWTHRDGWAGMSDLHPNCGFALNGELGALKLGGDGVMGLSSLRAGLEFAYGLDFSVGLNFGLNRHDTPTDAFKAGTALPSGATSIDYRFNVTPGFGIVLNLTPSILKTLGVLSGG